MMNILSSASTTLRLAIQLAILGIAIVIGLALYRFLTPTSGIVVNTSGATVVKEIRELQRLETAIFTLEKIIDAETQGNALQKILFGDKILLIAHGQVAAGFDLANLGEDAVTVEGKKVTVKLGAPQVLFTRLDNEKTRVYDRRLGLLTKGEKDLETEARDAAEKSIRVGACESKILTHATENGRKQLTALLSGLGFEEVQIEISEGVCQ